jgi:putative transposase
MSDRDVISDEAWAFIAPLLPSSAGRRGGQWRDHRQVLEAIAWRYRTGSPWRDLPARFGPWPTV